VEEKEEDDETKVEVKKNKEQIAKKTMKLTQEQVKVLRGTEWMFEEIVRDKTSKKRGKKSNKKSDKPDPNQPFIMAWVKVKKASDKEQTEWTNGVDKWSQVGWENSIEMLEKEERKWTADRKSKLWSMWRETETGKLSRQGESDMVLEWDGKLGSIGAITMVFGSERQKTTVELSTVLGSLRDQESTGSDCQVIYEESRMDCSGQEGEECRWAGYSSNCQVEHGVVADTESESDEYNDAGGLSEPRNEHAWERLP
jgi:hypothetical protein